MNRRIAGMAFLLISLTDVFSCKTQIPAGRPTLTTSKRILGISASGNENYLLMKEAGIKWVRLYFHFPFEDMTGGKLSANFLNDLEAAKKIRQVGLRIMGSTPLAGSVGWDEKAEKPSWQPEIPASAGSIDSNGYYETYEKACEELARQTRGVVDMWQVSNEMDVPIFRGPLTIQQAERFMTAGGRGVKKGNPEAKTDINPGGLESGERFFRDIYPNSDTPFDYAGIDGYFGSWQPGGPQDWVPVIEKIHEITGKPVLVNEWGYSSIEGSGKALKKKIGISVCDQQRWNNAWRKEHSPEEQAAYVQIAVKIFATYPNVAGCFFYEWKDDAVCGHCGNKDCPAECGWGMVDIQGRPKPVYFAFKSMAHEFF